MSISNLQEKLAAIARDEAPRVLSQMSTIAGLRDLGNDSSRSHMLEHSMPNSSHAAGPYSTPSLSNSSE
ncbi:MAG: hypothetical protein KIT27_08135 [Legionellales bacterium]|nr:hypothetical protein [Legionellales bacterium]